MRIWVKFKVNVIPGWIGWLIKVLSRFSAGISSVIQLVDSVADPGFLRGDANL